MMPSKSVREFLEAIAPRWEDPHEFDWLREVEEVPAVIRMKRYINENNGM
jgi:hypothetical protein